MSHFVDLETQITDTKALVRALERLGFKGKIEIYEKTVPIYGYMGDERPEKAHVVIRKQHVGPSSNDIGFEKRPDGKFVAHISEFDMGTGDYSHRKAPYGETWQKKLYQLYGVEKSKIEFENKGWDYVEDTDEKERPRLRVRL